MAVHDYSTRLEKEEFIEIVELTQASNILHKFRATGELPPKRRFVFFGKQDPYAVYSVAVAKMREAAPYLDRIFGYDLPDCLKRLHATALRRPRPEQDILWLGSQLTNFYNKYRNWQRFLRALMAEINSGHALAKSAQNPRHIAALQKIDKITDSLNKFISVLKNILRLQRTADRLL